MSNVNIGQLRTCVQNLPAGQLVKIQAGTLLALLNLVKTLQSGSEATVTAQTTSSPLPEVDLSRF